MSADPLAIERRWMEVVRQIDAGWHWQAEQRAAIGQQYGGDALSHDFILPGPSTETASPNPSTRANG